MGIIKGHIVLLTVINVLPKFCQPFPLILLDFVALRKLRVTVGTSQEVYNNKKGDILLSEAYNFPRN